MEAMYQEPSHRKYSEKSSDICPATAWTRHYNTRSVSRLDKTSEIREDRESNIGTVKPSRREVKRLRALATETTGKSLYAVVSKYNEGYDNKRQLTKSLGWIVTRLA